MIFSDILYIRASAVGGSSLQWLLFVLIPISDGIYRKSENINIPKILFLGYSQIFFISAPAR